MNKLLLILFIVICHSLQGFSQSLQELQSKLKQQNSEQDLSKIHSDIGNAFYKNGKFPDALEHYYKSLDIAEKAGIRKTVAVSYHGIGSVYLETEKYDDAIKYLTKAQQLFSELKEFTSLGRVLISIGNVHYMQVQDSLSESYYSQALRVCSTTNDSACMMDGYKNLGALYFEMGSREDTLKGLSFIKKSLEYIHSKDTYNQFQSNLTLAELYTYTGYLTEAKSYLDVCTSLLPGISAMHVIDDYYYCMHQYHKEKGAFDQALSSFKLYKVYQDSILTTENAKQLSELNVKYETQQKEKQIHLLKAQKDAQQLTLVIIIMLVTFSAIITTYLFVRYRKKQKLRKEQELQKQKEAERVRIARDMHDEIGAGLTRIVMRSTQVKMHLQAGKELKNGIVETLEKMELESRQLSHNIGEIIWSLNPKNDTLDALFAYIRNYAYDYLEEAGIASKFDFPDRIYNISVLPELQRNVFLIVKEALTNLVKYSRATEAEIIVQVSENNVSVIVKDNGQGMDLSSNPNGNGLGNMKKRAEENGGKFLIQTEPGKGTWIIIENLCIKNQQQQAFI